MKQFATRQCAHCGTDYTPTGPAQRMCSKACKYKARWARERKRRAAAGNPVGKKGGSYGRRGKDHWCYKHGIREFQTRLRYQVKEEERCCNTCGKDLTEAAPHEWCVHHKDHDRTNNVRSNLTLLCKRCHQMEHRCWENLPNK